MKMYKHLIRAVMLLLAAALVCCGCAQSLPLSNGSVANDPGDASVLTLSHAALELSVDGPCGSLHPFHAADAHALEWSVADSAVAEVSGGRLTAVSEGTTVVTCTDGVNTASCTVTVRGTADAGYTLRLSDRELSAAVGDSGKVEYTYTGPGAVAVFSSDPGVLLVENGRWEAIAAGTAYITCTDGLKHVQCKVTVAESAA